MSKIDRLLEEAGARWRSQQRASPNIGPELYPRVTASHQASSTVWALLGAVIIGAVLVGGLLVREQGFSLVGASQPPGSEGSLLSVGDAVSARGAIIREQERYRICLVYPTREFGYTSGNEPPPSCSAIAIDLVGVDPTSIPNWVERQGVGFVLNVRVQGRWDGSSIRLDRVDPDSGGAGSQPPRFTLPCATPQGGWAPDPTPPLEAEQAIARLGTEVSAHPELYSGLWRGQAEGTGSLQSGATAMVVGTVGDLSAVRRHLQSVYPYALCVVSAGFSAQQLQALADRLRSAEPDWMIEVQPDRDRVVVQLAVLDRRALSVIGPNGDMTLVEPLVEPTP